MKSRNPLLICLITLSLYGCNDFNETASLKETIRIVSKENNCNFELNILNNSENEVAELKTQCNIDSPYFFGKLLLDFYKISQNDNIHFKEYKIKDKNNELILSVSADEMRRITELQEIFKKDVNLIEKNNFTDFYKRFHSELRKDYNIDSISNNMDVLSQDSPYNYNGWFIMDQSFGKSIIFSGANQSSSMLIFYLANKKDNSIFGFNLE